MTAHAFPADANIRDIDALWSAVQATLNGSGSEVELDAAAVERPDTAFVQLLAVAVLRAREQGKTVKVVRASQRLRDLVRLVALDVVLAD